nr:RNA-directed DNA polymerase, eukaryota [Tanacetum cinerariifolium]
VPRGVLKSMEAIQSKFFNGADYSDKKIMWVAWDKVLASKKNEGLGVSSFHALNRALLLKWVWHFISQDGSLWFRVIQALAVRDGTERHQMLGLNSMLDSVSLSSAQDRWICDLSGDGEFRVKEDLSSFSDWHSWFSSIRLPINVKSMLEGVFCVAWWVIWVLRNRTIFDETHQRRSVIFDDIVSYSFNWCSSRCSRVFSWETLLKKPSFDFFVIFFLASC